MEEQLKDNARKQGAFIPTCSEYRRLLDYAHNKTGEEYSALREKLGNATYAQWAEYLNV